MLSLLGKVSFVFVFGTALRRANKIGRMGAFVYIATVVATLGFLGWPVVSGGAATLYGYFIIFQELDCLLTVIVY